VLQDKNKIIEEKNKDIVDSINYAKRIQGAILPEEALLTRLLPEHFLYFQPKDIVSGDFYWVAEKNNTVLLAAADCTGHGVPGAFMSMIGNAFLNEVVNEKGIVAPAEILNKLREMIIGALKQGEGSDSKDGMDITLVSLSKSGEETHVKFAGANNPIWIIQSGNLREIKGDKQPVGVSSGLVKGFTEHSFSLTKGDQLYLFSDGFADQFGGKDGKKFRSKNMQDLVMSVHDQSMLVQKRTLAEKMDQWKSELEQVDDMLVIGLRI
jgi:serine phosphatase RsbU (regulator of sigma subunit)